MTTKMEQRQEAKAHGSEYEIKIGKYGDAEAMAAQSYGEGTPEAKAFMSGVREVRSLEKKCERAHAAGKSYFKKESDKPGRAAQTARSRFGGAAPQFASFMQGFFEALSDHAAETAGDWKTKSHDFIYDIYCDDEVSRIA